MVGRRPTSARPSAGWPWPTRAGTTGHRAPIPGPFLPGAQAEVMAARRRPGQGRRNAPCLGHLAAADGGDDVAAAANLAWALMPGAWTLANKLRTLSAHLDQIVPAQMWLEVRTFPWRRLTMVAAHVLTN